MKLRTLSLFIVFSGCSQSTVVFDPVQNKSPTISIAPTQGLLSINIDLSGASYAANVASKAFGVLVFQNGTLMAGMYNNGAAAGVTATNGTAQATTPLFSVNVANSCVQTGTNATLQNGSYDVYFGIQYAAETPTIVNPGSIPNPSTAVCSATNGFIQGLSSNNLYGGKTSVTVSGDTTFSFTNSNTVPLKQHTFQLDVGTGTLASKNFRCYVMDINTTAMTAIRQPLAVFTGSTDANGRGCSVGPTGSTIMTNTGPPVNYSCTASAVSHRLPTGSYKYFCLIDMNGNGNYLETSPADKVSSGVVAVTGSNTTFMVSGDFADLTP